MRKLILTKPLAVLDIESTGANPRLDRIIELAIIKIHPDRSQTTNVFRINPERAIPPEATAIHKITDADVAGCPVFKDLAPQIFELLRDSDLAGFGVIRFDIPMLTEEFARAGIDFDDSLFRIIDAQRIYHKKEPRDLTAALAFYCREMHLGAHRAENDVLATIRVLDAQVDHYPDLPLNLEELDRYCHPPRNPQWVDRTGKLKWENGEIVINFGVQNIGQSLKHLLEQNRKFLKWILKSDFPGDTKKIVNDAFEGKFPPPPPVPEPEE